jgi:hypothetical protein
MLYNGFILCFTIGKAHIHGTFPECWAELALS